MLVFMSTCMYVVWSVCTIYALSLLILFSFNGPYTFVHHGVAQSKGHANRNCSSYQVPSYLDCKCLIERLLIPDMWFGNCETHPYPSPLVPIFGIWGCSELLRAVGALHEMYWHTCITLYTYCSIMYAHQNHLLTHFTIYISTVRYMGTFF